MIVREFFIVVTAVAHADLQDAERELQKVRRKNKTARLLKVRLVPDEEVERDDDRTAVR